MFPRPFFSYRVQFPHFLEMKLSKGHVRITIILYGIYRVQEKKMLPKSFSFYEFYLPADLKNRFTTKEYYYKLYVIFQSCHGFFPDEIYSSRFQLDLFLVLCVC